MNSLTKKAPTPDGARACVSVSTQGCEAHAEVALVPCTSDFKVTFKHAGAVGDISSLKITADLVFGDAEDDALVILQT